MYGIDPRPPAPIPISSRAQTKNKTSGESPSSAEPAINKTTASSKAFLLPMRSPNLLQSGVNTDMPSKKTETIRPMQEIPCKSAIMAGSAVFIIVASSPDITLAKSRPTVIT